MARAFFAFGSLAILTAPALVFPVVVGWLEHGEVPGVGIGLGVVSCALLVLGVVAIWTGYRRRKGATMPSGVRAAITANILILSFFALELSDRLVRQEGKIVYWSTFLSLPALLLMCGLVAARPWAWWISRIATSLAALWFLVFIAVIPFASLHTDEGPTPWYGRVYMVCVSLAFAGVMYGAFWSLGRPATRSYFGTAR